MLVKKIMLPPKKGSTLFLIMRNLVIILRIPIVHLLQQLNQ